MTADPVSTPEREPRLLTVAEYLALGETELGYDELVEGRVCRCRRVPDRTTTGRCSG